VRRIAWLCCSCSPLPFRGSTLLTWVSRWQRGPGGGIGAIAGCAPAVLQAGRLRIPAHAVAGLLFICGSAAHISGPSMRWPPGEDARLLPGDDGGLAGYGSSPRVLGSAHATAPYSGRFLVLAVLTLADFASPFAMATEQIRFAATGRTPTMWPAFSILGFPMAALLYDGEQGWPASCWRRVICRWASSRCCSLPRAVDSWRNSCAGGLRCSAGARTPAQGTCRSLRVAGGGRKASGSRLHMRRLSDWQPSQSNCTAGT